MAGVEVTSTSMMASMVASSSTLSSWPPRVTNPWRDAAQDLAGGPGGLATKHPTCRQLGGQARGTERQHPLPPAPSGLVDLATVLGKRAEDRDALLAVVAALALVGITEALDLSFLGSGDVLPSETVAEVLGDCAVHGAAEALKHMFRIARDGMEGSVSLMLLHLGPTRRAPSKPEVTGQAWKGLSGSKAKRRVLAAVDPAPPQKRVRHSKDETSFNRQLLPGPERTGLRVATVHERQEPSQGQEESVMKLQTNAFIHNFSSPKSLNAARRKFETYLLAMRGLNVNLLDPEEWTLAAFITGQAQRGASSPRKMVQTLAWAERAFELSLGLESPLVQAQRSSWTPGAETRARKPAKTASMENLPFEVESNMMRCWAGAQCAMAHGCLRWADLQATKNLKLTKDAVFGVSWRMKGKKTHVPWAALRVGFTGRDWGSAWLSELAAAGLPGEDFILKAPNSSWTSFANRIADFSDGQAAMRALLVKAGMTVKSVMEYSCHSWRHLSNCWSTAGRAPGGSGCHGPLVPWDGDGSPLRWYGVCFGVAEQGEGPQGSVRRMGPFRARLLAGQTRSDAHGENATPVQCIIVFIPRVHASGFITQTFESFAHSEGGSEAQGGGSADTHTGTERRCTPFAARGSAAHQRTQCWMRCSRTSWM